MLIQVISFILAAAASISIGIVLLDIVLAYARVHTGDTE